jgi:hypothetical protein
MSARRGRATRRGETPCARRPAAPHRSLRHWLGPDVGRDPTRKPAAKRPTVFRHLMHNRALVWCMRCVCPHLLRCPGRAFLHCAAAFALCILVLCTGACVCVTFGCACKVRHVCVTFGYKCNFGGACRCTAIVPAGGFEQQRLHTLAELPTLWISEAHARQLLVAHGFVARHGHAVNQTLGPTHEAEHPGAGGEQVAPHDGLADVALRERPTLGCPADHVPNLQRGSMGWGAATVSCTPWTSAAAQGCYGGKGWWQMQAHCTPPNCAAHICRSVH